MKLTNINIKSFRSFVNSNLKIKDNCIGFIGLNESGKTNLLDAIRSLDKDHPFKINDKSGKASHLRPSITSDEIGNFTIAWEDKSDFSGNLYVQRYQGDGTPQGTNSIIYNDNRGGFYPSISR